MMPSHRQPAAAPGFFNAFCHRLPDAPLTMVLNGPEAQLAGLDGRTVYFAVCDAACLEPTADARNNLPWCPTCWPWQTRHRR